MSKDIHFKTRTLSRFCCVQDRTVEISLRLSPKQLEHVTPVLEEIIHEIVEERQKGTAFKQYELK